MTVLSTTIPTVVMTCFVEVVDGKFNEVANNT